LRKDAKECDQGEVFAGNLGGALKEAWIEDSYGCGGLENGPGKREKPQLVTRDSKSCLKKRQETRRKVSSKRGIKGKFAKRVESAGREMKKRIKSEKG